ncbi:uncharacterized protein si:ch73-204p21.2 isoform X1 [Platichthys flesus]|uniref:uncharacterized protein si:ch73-204p21.2 isoform X1 n=1 Tax=Platichthys flesus TaxID=8260 RepID=UPI002DBDC6F7|nr:uncharacterized protein si:ch73-204p21.2 isoform X1 [Platichthys flesus]
MAAVGAGVIGVIGSWSLSSGVVGSFIILLLLSILLSALCSECSRRSFELQDSERDANPSTLISVVKLEETLTSRDNPVISKIQNDEKDFRPSEGNLVSFPSWKSHLGAPQNGQDVLTNGSAAAMESSLAAESRAVAENSVQFTTWRSHLRAPEQQEPNHIYHSIGRGRTDSTTVTPRTNPDQEGGDRARPDVKTLEFSELNSVYAQVSRKMRQAPPPVQTPVVAQVREGEEGEEPSPPLPDRETE